MYSDKGSYTVPPSCVFVRPSLSRGAEYVVEKMVRFSNVTYGRLGRSSLDLASLENGSFALFYLEIKKRSITVVSAGRSHRLGYEEDGTTKRSPTQSARGLQEEKKGGEAGAGRPRG